MVLVSVFETSPGWLELRFPYNKPLIAALKLIPGVRWQPERKSWFAPSHAMPALQRVAAALAKFVPMAKLHSSTPPQLFPGMLANLRPYQVDGAQRLIDNKSFLLSFDMRVGKTRTATVAAASLLASGHVKTIALLYPNVAKNEWARQFKDQTGLEPVQFEGTTCFDPLEFNRLVALPHLAVGIHYELDGKFSDTGRGAEFVRLLEARGKFVVVADEVQWLKNRKAGRTKWALEKVARSNMAAWRWALTGTPMRNYPRDMWAMFDFMQPDSMGSYSAFTRRYAGGHMGDYGWVDDAVTHNEELAERLTATSFRLTRRDVAAWLPKSERSVVLCNMSAAEQKLYKKQEAALGQSAVKAMNDGDSAQAKAALKQLVSITTNSKMGVMLDRIFEHAEQRRVKVLVFANFHETLTSAWDRFEAETPFAPTPQKQPRFAVPGFLAGGWMTSDRRQKAIAQWKACPGPAVLFANMLSSGTGIDLADAEVALFVELTWVPADFMQAEARIQDVHLGKRTTPPIYEYLLVRGTVDEDMGLKLINKVAAIEKVVGADAETKGVGSALRDSGLVDRNVLALASEDDETVNSVLADLRARLFGDETPDDLGETHDNAEHEAEDEPEENDDNDE